MSEGNINQELSNDELKDVAGAAPHITTWGVGNTVNGKDNTGEAIGDDLKNTVRIKDSKSSKKKNGYWDWTQEPTP